MALNKLGGIGAVGGAALAALSLVLTPALAQQQERSQPRAAPSLRSGGFTPAVADPKLAAHLARRGVRSEGFRFTPSSAAAAGSEKKQVRVAVRARASTPVEVIRSTAGATAAVTPITPTAYNLGVSVGWKNFAVSGDVGRVDRGVAPGSREDAAASVSYSANRFTGRIEAGASRPSGAAPRVLAEDETYSVGVGGSFRLTRNLDVTGGVKYKIHRDRLETLADDRHDSQAVYVGTAFRF